MRSERGMTLVGVLAGITLSTVALTTTVGRLESQVTSAGFTESSGEIAARTTGQSACSISAGGSDQQPLVVYASAFRFGFEAPCTGTDANSLLADSRAPSAPMTFAGAADDMLDWPADMAATGADTISYFFQADRSTPRTDDFVLVRQVGAQRAEPVLRNVLAYPGRPFFQYYYQKMVDNSRRAQPAPASWLPLQHTSIKHGSAADTGLAARIDTLRAVEVNYSVTNGRTGADERVRLMSVTVAFASLGLKKRAHPCDNHQLFSQASFVRQAAYDPDTDEDVSLDDALINAAAGSACTPEW